jgi:hypothetical protein
MLEEKNVETMAIWQDSYKRCSLVTKRVLYSHAPLNYSTIRHLASDRVCESRSSHYSVSKCSVLRRLACRH